MAYDVFHEQRGHGADLILVHGWSVHGGIWGRLPEYLARRFRVTLLDLPGHGRSRAAGTLTLERLAESVAAIVAAPAVWLGWSLGGMVTLAAALRHAPLVRQAVLVGTTPRFVQAPDWDCAMSTAQLGQFGADLKDDYRATLERFLSLQIGNVQGAGGGARALIRGLRAELFRHGPPDRRALDDGLSLLRDSDLRAGLAGIELPVQIIHGARDRLVPLAAAEFMASRLPNARLDVIEGAGHAPFLSHGEAFVRVLDRFLHD